MLENKVILVADDDLTLSEMYASRLKSDGVIAEVARDGEEAIQMAKENRPHVILLDIMMPKQNGLDVLKQLKEDEATKNIPVIILSVLAESEKIQQAKALGAADYIVKSESMPAEVVDKIKNILLTIED